jgi:hypothetical protein
MGSSVEAVVSCLEISVPRFGTMEKTMESTSVIKAISTMQTGATSLGGSSLAGSAQMEDLGPLIFAGTGVAMGEGFHTKSVMITI